MYKCENCGKAFECDKPLRDGDALCPACSGECTKAAGEALADDGVVLINGVMSFEVETICKRLDRANIRFSLQPMSANESGIINARPENAAAGLTNIANAFSSSGLSTCYQIRVAAEDYAKAKELVGQSEENQITESEPPPKSAFTDPEPDSEKNKGCVGIWGWNTIPVLNLIAVIGGGLYMAATQHFPAFFNGLMWAFWTKGCEAYNFPMGVFIAIELAFNLGLATFAFYALILLAKRSVSYPKLTTRIFWTAAVAAGLDFIVARHFQIEVTAREKQEMFRGAIFAMIWMSYFAKSERIKNTFVNARAKLRRGWLAVSIVLAVSALFCWIGMRSNNPLANIEATKTYICFLQTRVGNGEEMDHIGCKAMVSDAELAGKSVEIELRLKAALGKRGIDDVGVVLNDPDDIVLAYSTKEKIPDEVLQKAIDSAELPISLDVIEQREYTPKNTSK